MGAIMCSAKQGNIKKTKSSTRQYLEQRIVVSEVVSCPIMYSARQDNVIETQSSAQQDLERRKKVSAKVQNNVTMLRRHRFLSCEIWARETSKHSDYGRNDVQCKTRQCYEDLEFNPSISWAKNKSKRGGFEHDNIQCKTIQNDVMVKYNSVQWDLSKEKVSVVVLSMIM